MHPTHPPPKDFIANFWALKEKKENMIKVYFIKKTLFKKYDDVCAKFTEKLKVFNKTKNIIVYSNIEFKTD